LRVDDESAAAVVVVVVVNIDVVAQSGFNRRFGRSRGRSLRRDDGVVVVHGDEFSDEFAIY